MERLEKNQESVMRQIPRVEHFPREREGSGVEVLRIRTRDYPQN